MMPKNSYLLLLLFTTHILGISAFDLKAAQQSNAVRDADEGKFSSAQTTGNLTPNGWVVSVVDENVTVTTCLEHNAPRTSTPAPPTSSSTPCNILASSTSSILTKNAAQADSTTVYPTTSVSTSPYSCSTGWATSTHPFTTTKTTTKTCTDEPLAMADPPVVSSPTSADIYVIDNSTDTTLVPLSTLPYATAGVYNYTTTLKFEPHPTSPSQTGSEERNTGSKDAVCEALGLAFIGCVAWLMVML